MKKTNLWELGLKLFLGLTVVALVLIARSACLFAQSFSTKLTVEVPEQITPTTTPEATPTVILPTATPVADTENISEPESKVSNNTKTGDETNLELWFVLLMLAGVCSVILCKRGIVKLKQN